MGRYRQNIVVCVCVGGGGGGLGGRVCCFFFVVFFVLFFFVVVLFLFLFTLVKLIIIPYILSSFSFIPKSTESKLKKCFCLNKKSTHPVFKEYIIQRS